MDNQALKFSCGALDSPAAAFHSPSPPADTPSVATRTCHTQPLLDEHFLYLHLLGGGRWVSAASLERSLVQVQND